MQIHMKQALRVFHMQLNTGLQALHVDASQLCMYRTERGIQGSLSRNQYPSRLQYLAHPNDRDSAPSTPSQSRGLVCALWFLTIQHVDIRAKWING